MAKKEIESVSKPETVDPEIELPHQNSTKKEKIRAVEIKQSVSSGPIPSADELENTAG